MSDDDDQLHLPTLTRLWLFPRYVYRIGDKALDTPINLRMLAWAALLMPTFWIASNVLPFGPLWLNGLGLVPRLIVPGLIVYVLLVKITHGAKPWEVLWHYLRLVWYRRPRKAQPFDVVLTSCVRTP